MSTDAKKLSTHHTGLSFGGVTLSAFSVLATLSGWLLPYSRLHLWFEGQIDGRLRTPLDGEKRAPFVSEMGEEFRKRTAQEKRRFEDKEAELKGDIAGIQGRLPRLKARLKSEIQPEYKESERQMHQLNDGCRGHHHRNLLAYGLVLFVLAAFDFPMQIAAFEAESYVGWQTWMICIGIAIVTCLAAHFAGDLANRKGRAARLGAVLICSVMIALFVMIAFLRIESFKRFNLTAELGITLSPRVGAIVYFIINISILTIAFIYSVLVHRTEERKCRIAKKAVGKRFLAASQQVESTKNRIERYEELLDHLKEELSALPSNAESTKAALSAILEKKHQMYLKTYHRVTRRLYL